MYNPSTEMCIIFSKSLSKFILPKITGKCTITYDANTKTLTVIISSQMQTFIFTEQQLPTLIMQGLTPATLAKNILSDYKEMVLAKYFH